MLTVQDIIHLIQYYYHTSSYDNAVTDVETFRLESLRGEFSHNTVINPNLLQKSKRCSV